MNNNNNNELTMRFGGDISYNVNETEEEFANTLDGTLSIIKARLIQEFNERRKEAI